MKLQIGQIVNAQYVLQKLADCNLSALGSFWIMRTIDKIKPIFQGYESERIKLVKKYGEEKVPDDKIDDYMKDLLPLLEESVEVELEAKDIQYLSGAVLTPSELRAIRFMLIE